MIQLICHSSGDDWKKLKKKLIALTLLHSLRVKNIVPLPVPLPLPVIIRKVSTPIILPAKRVPFLVPKPVPYYQIIPNFVPLGSNDKGSYIKSESNINSQKTIMGTDGQDLWPESSTNEEYMDPDYELISKELMTLMINQEKHRHLLPHQSHDYHIIQQSLANINNNNNNNKYSLNNIKDFIKEKSGLNSLPLNDYREYKPWKGRFNYKKQPLVGVMEDMHELNAFYNTLNALDNEDDLLMLSSQPKTKPQEQSLSMKILPSLNNFNINNRNVSQNRHFLNSLPIMMPTNEPLVPVAIPVPFTPKVTPKPHNNSNHLSSNPGDDNVLVKRVKVGEIRLKPKQIRSLLPPTPR
ncbi:uncharacterized protein LOC128955904 [Oppia nitens]|uniref:uncharacterized protein LOC128955904 n=1 Tax=Oppia nitens TaxID=1686743 RepID=UPI0023DC8524|nr:uncharacterized protein LOC128955904 [Oppia nitens]